MGLVVETGAGLPNADSYISLSESNTYHTNMGNTSWESIDDDIKEQCLRKATRYMRQQYRSLWKGERVKTTQSLDWPRFGVVIDNYTWVDNNVVPQEIKNACAELALRATIGELNADLTQAVKEETIGPLTVKYDENSSRRVTYGSIVAELQPYFKNGSSGSNIKLVRC